MQVTDTRRPVPIHRTTDLRAPWWVVSAAALAPVLLIGGWTVAATFQPPTYLWTRDTISALARIGAPDRWFMTTAFAGLGVCYVLIAFGLRAAAPAGRMVLLIGGGTTIRVSALPLPPIGTSQAHGLVALVGFLAMALWPLAAARWSGATETTPWAFRLPVAIAATAALLLINGWFGLTLLPHEMVGVSERASAAAEALWPLAVVLSTRVGALRVTAVERTPTG
ncbi:MAG TPA: DUF998 domain-containing protein [Micromonosporaceae bacterium]